MEEFWESKYKTEGAMWKLESSDSALNTIELFKKHNINKILIPGVGYGRNAKVFYEQGFEITGIEISETAIALARTNGLNFKIHHGSVAKMPFDNDMFEGIFCYALIHLLNKNERKAFMQACFNQLKPGGLMVFTVVSTEAAMYGQGKLLSKNRFGVMPGLSVFFYTNEIVKKEFSQFGLIECKDIDEPIKHVEGHQPLKCKFIICQR